MIQPINTQNPHNKPRHERPAPAPIVYNTDYNAIKISINGASVNAPAPNSNAGQNPYGEYNGRNDRYPQQQDAPYNYPQANLYDYPQAPKQAYYPPNGQPVGYLPPADDVARNYCTCLVCGTITPPQEVTSQPVPVEVPQPQVVTQKQVSNPVPQVMQQNINYAVANAPAPVITAEDKCGDVSSEAKDDVPMLNAAEKAEPVELPAQAVTAAAVVPEDTPQQAIAAEEIDPDAVNKEDSPIQDTRTEEIEAEKVVIEKTAEQAIADDRIEAEAVKAEAVAAAAVTADDTPVQAANSEEVEVVDAAEEIPAQEIAQEAPKVEIKEPEELKPQIDINAFIAELANPDFDKQAVTMQAIALLVKQDPEKATELLDEGVINALKDIMTADTKDLIGPTKEQSEARIKIRQGKEVSDIERELANTITPLEQAERNKSYALFSMAILEKLFNSEVEKLSGQIVPFKDIPGIMTVVEQMSSNPNPMVRISAIEALSYVQRPEYKEDLNALFNIALNDSDRAVRETAKAASEKLNEA